MRRIIPSRVADLVPQVGPRAWAILTGNSLSATGFGLIFPFLMVYLHRVRGFELGMAGTCLAAISLGGLAGVPFAGVLTDRVGPRRVLLAGQLFAGGGIASLAFVHDPWQTLVSALLMGLGFAAWMAPEMALLATAVPPAQRSSVYALEYATTNLGFGAGAIIGGVVLDVTRPATFEVAFICSALPLLVFVGILMRLGDRGPYSEEEAEDDATGQGPADRGYRAVLDDRVFALVAIFYLALMIVAGSQLDATFPAYATGQGGVGTRVIGFAFAANTMTIVIGQLVVLRALRGRRRTRAMLVSCAACAACWLVTLVAGHLGGGTLAAAGFIAALVVFAVGEMTWSPSVPGIVNDLAPATLRGRYNAVIGAAEGGGRMIGPAIAGFVLEAGLGDELLAGLALACAATALLVLRIERRLPPSANLIGAEFTEAAGDAVLPVRV